MTTVRMFEFFWSNPASRFLIMRSILPLLGGLVWPLLQRQGIGSLPGDVVVEREGFRFYLPVVTSILVSLALALVLWLFNR